MNIFITDLKQIINRANFISAHLSRLNTTDLLRFENIKNERRALQFLLGRLLILDVLGPDYNTTDNGKVISNSAYLSLAHSGDFVILATDDEPIGIDIEKIDQKRNFLKIANRLKFKNCRTVQDFYKYFTAYEAEFKLGKEYQKPYHLFFEREDFMICVATLSKKSIETITQKNFL